MSTELRLALAMRGGVSLAVWIGGAVAEIDRARRADPTDGERQDFWSQVLRDATTYELVVVDVLAGASAGGLNGALYAASQVYDFEFDAVRDVWLDVGSTEKLVRRKGPWLSLFDGDKDFLDTLARSLRTLTDPTGREGSQPTSRPRVDLALSATVMEPIVRPLASAGGLLLDERRYAAGFRFRQPEEGWLPTDFAPSGEEGFDATLWRLAIAARSTSSFPVAFEGAEVRSSRRPTFTSAPLPTAGKGRDTDLDGMFLDRTTDALPFVVADGGILDNIPIKCALDFIANAPAAGPTERYLVYLQPGASTAPDASDREETGDPDSEPSAQDRLVRRSTQAVLRGVLAARVAGETINADIAAMEAYNEAIVRAATLRHATFDGLDDRDAFLAAARTALGHGPDDGPDDGGPDRGGRPTYQPARAAHEAHQAFALLLDPMGVIGEDQFPAAVAGEDVDDGCWRSPIATWPQSDREGLEALLYEEIDGILGGAEASLLTCTGDIGPLLRVTDLLIEWARWVETSRPEGGSGSSTPSDVKRSLYRVRAFLGATLERTRRLAWVSVAARAGDETGQTFVTSALASLRRLTLVDPAMAERIVLALRNDDDGPLAEACREAMGLIEPTVRECASPEGRSERVDTQPPAETDLLARIAELLVGLVAPLADDRTGEAPEQRGSDAKTRESGKRGPGELLDRVLGGGPVDLETLEAIEALCLPEFVSGVPGRRRITFHRLSTANRTPLAPHFTALLAAARDLGTWWDPAEESPEKQSGIHVGLKLAGNELANFSAFLLAPWRANDWLWGRLDAVTTLVDLLVRPEHLATRLAGRTADEALAAIHDLVVPLGHELAPTLEAHAWAPFAAGIAHELGELLHALAGPVQAGPVKADTVQAETVKSLPIASIRTALIARRQWEVLYEEKPRPKEDMGTRPGEASVSLEDWVSQYAVGAETLQTEAHTGELLDRFGELATAATEVAIYNAELPTPRLPDIAKTALRRAGPRVGSLLAKKLVVPAKPGGSRTKYVLGLVVTLLALAAVLGWVADRWAFVLGLAVAAIPLIGVVLFLYLTLLRAGRPGVNWLLGPIAAALVLVGGFVLGEHVVERTFLLAVGAVLVVVVLAGLSVRGIASRRKTKLRDGSEPVGPG